MPSGLHPYSAMTHSIQAQQHTHSTVRQGRIATAAYSILSFIDQLKQKSLLLDPTQYSFYALPLRTGELWMPSSTSCKTSLKAKSYASQSLGCHAKVGRLPSINNTR